jgi:type II secretory pathway pseudopilin PulG
MANGDARLPQPGRQRGFGYLMALFALAAVGLALAATGEVWHTAARRSQEAELLFVGGQFRQAIASYYRAGPAGARVYPLTLEELIEDRRFPVPRRHLRRIYRDPVTGQAQWGLVRASGRLVGVHSLSKAQPLRTAFGLREAAFADAAGYDQWVFGPDANTLSQQGPTTPIPVPQEQK